MRRFRYISLLCLVVIFIATITFYEYQTHFFSNVNVNNQNILIEQDFEMFPRCAADDRSRQRSLYYTLQGWNRFARQHKIQYWLAYETLIGYFQRRGMLPYINYLDVFIMAHDTSKLVELSSLNFSSTYQLKVHPQWYIADRAKRSRFESEGIDFVGPNAQFIDLNDRIYVNIWPMYNYHPNRTRMVSISTSTITGYDKNGVWKSFPKEWIFPLQECIFSGIKVYCPAEPVQLVMHIYDDEFLSRLPTKCVNGSWLGLEDILFKTTIRTTREDTDTTPLKTDIPSTTTDASDEEVIEKALLKIPKCTSKDLRRQRIILNSLQAWARTAEQYNIEYWLAYGTLVGYVQRHGLLPHDPDSDVMIMFYNTPKLIELAQSNFSSTYEIRVQPQWKVFDESKRSYFHDQGIHFVAPNARFIHRKSKYHVDIFPAYNFNPVDAEESADYKKLENLTIYDLEYKWMSHPRNWTYPLKKCNFSDIILWCPAEPEKQVVEVYGASALNKSDTKCVDGKWVEER